MNAGSGSGYGIGPAGRSSRSVTLTTFEFWVAGASFQVAEFRRPEFEVTANASQLGTSAWPRLST